MSHDSKGCPPPGLSRRRFLTLSSAALVIAPFGGAALAGSASAISNPPSVWVYHPMLASPKPYSVATQVINVVEDQNNGWRMLRSLGQIHSAAGITSWSDLLIVRGQLESQGMRLAESVERGPAFHWLFIERIG